MPTVQPDLWGGADAYERYMGRWSRRIAPHFTAWVAAPPGASWLDIGCGTGVLTSTVLDTCEPARVVAIDSSDMFLQTARARCDDPRVSFRPGDAQALPEDDGAFDIAVSGLVLNFLPDKIAAVREMVRVVRPEGMVALYVWDYAGHMQVMRHFFDAATALDPRASEYDDGVKAPVCRPGPLSELFASAGLTEIEVRPIDIPTAFASFDDYWAPFLGGTGSAPKYCLSLGDDARNRLRDAVRARLPTGPDGEILLAARAWAAKARVPEISGR
ncbi:class I SAM-dependent methyltransferase [Oceanibacterium hippocampi]|uniref:Demethylmenaquinone methyltransferase n=1 Tax=Oceanibacterium hippocampi TaxID=745714 RepID=A0A1Y5SIL8_9PROT|nr:class I SAM-dependent methyltransferase [Oceanibacterium hippocampi]SLN41544.1 Demethylmenaquinone methyltransferase [Oceanibacterium hippocampi]